MACLGEGLDEVWRLWVKGLMKHGVSGEGLDEVWRLWVKGLTKHGVSG
jgi:predicted RNase H-like HicB family nuclease